MPVKSKPKAEAITVPVEVTGLVKSVEKSSSAVMIIASDAQYEEAGRFLNEVGVAIKQVNDLRLTMTRPLDQSKKRIMEVFQIQLDKLAAAKHQVSNEMLAYHRQQEELARAERVRVEQEEARRLEKIREAEESGNNRMLKRWTDKPAPIAEVEVPRAAGTAVRITWTFRVLDPLRVPREYLTVDEGALQRAARDLKEEASVPGVEFYPEETMVRTGR